MEIDSSKCPLGCNICVGSCPTNALYFFQKVNVQQELCVGCGACIFSCMYDGVIKITRTSKNGIKEHYESKRSFTLISNSTNSRKRVKTI
ncbi:MAG: 4Fe-4S dicluster domain-containing protein [Candidatus Hodarchaeales archaeon]